MSKNLVSQDTNMSKSAAKRNQRRREVAARKNRKRMIRIISLTVCCLVVLGIGFYVGQNIYFNATKTVASSDYSAGLTDDGKIDGLDVSNYVKVPDYNSISFSRADLEYSDEDVEADIEKALQNHLLHCTDTSVTLASGDKINLDYVGYVDEEPFENGDTQGNGTDLELGSGTYIDTFEDQIIGHNVGDSFDVNVTFPDPYENNPDLSGKDARFEVTINYVYQKADFDDAFVAEYLGDYATTAEGYRQYLKDTHYKTNLESAVRAYITDNAHNSSYPKKYLKSLKSLQRADDESRYSYMNNYYSQMLGTVLYESFEDFIGMSERAYEKDLSSRAKAIMEQNMLYQYIYETENLKYTDEAYEELIAEYGSGFGMSDSEAVEDIFGKGYLAQQAIQNTVVQYLCEKANVE